MAGIIKQQPILIKAKLILVRQNAESARNAKTFFFSGITYLHAYTHFIILCRARYAGE
jgi:hypothetical protein